MLSFPSKNPRAFNSGRSFLVDANVPNNLSLGGPSNLFYCELMLCRVSRQITA